MPPAPTADIGVWVKKDGGSFDRADLVRLLLRREQRLQLQRHLRRRRRELGRRRRSRPRPTGRNGVEPGDSRQATATRPQDCEKPTPTPTPTADRGPDPDADADGEPTGRPRPRRPPADRDADRRGLSETGKPKTTLPPTVDDRRLEQRRHRLGAADHPHRTPRDRRGDRAPEPGVEPVPPAEPPGVVPEAPDPGPEPGSPRPGGGVRTRRARRAPCSGHGLAGRAPDRSGPLDRAPRLEARLAEHQPSGQPRQHGRLELVGVPSGILDPAA